MAEQTTIETLEAYAASLSESSVRANTAAAQQHEYVNGAATVDVQTENGPVPTLAKQAVLGQEKITAALVEVASQLSGSMSYKDTAAGIAGTNPGGFFSVPVPGADEAMIIYENVNGTAVEYARMGSAKALEKVAQKTQNIEQDPDPYTVFSIADDRGHAALAVTHEAKVLAPDLVVESMGSTGESDIYSLAFCDKNGNVAFGIGHDGKVIVGLGDQSEPGQGVTDTSWQELTLGKDEVIVHIGDSFTASHYPVRDKSYVSQLSALSPFRHQSFGVSGNDLLDMQYRAVNDIATVGSTFRAMKAKYAFITSWNNDAQFRDADLSYYAENLRRMVDTVRAFGAEPVITSQFHTVSADFALLARIAEETGCAFIDCSTINREIGNLQIGPFMQGPGVLHPGTRTGGVFWLPMLDFIDRMPKPEQAIKIYRKRNGFTPAGAADLLYKDRLDRAKKWKELTVFHYSLNPEAKYDELGKLAYNSEAYTWFRNDDEYQKLAAGNPVAFTDYGLLEITLPGGANSLEAVELTLGVTGDAQVFVRNLLDIPASMPGKNQGASPTDSTYLSKWDKPRGAWRNLGLYSSKITLAQSDLATSMVGNTVVVMLNGAFSLTSLKVRYKGQKNVRPLARRRLSQPIGPNLLAQPLCGTTAQQAGWVVSGSPAIVVPIDLYNAPRKPGVAAPIDGVTVVTATDTITQSVSIPAHEGYVRKYRITVWARYFPKAYLRPDVYPGLDPSQVVDREAFPNNPTITQDTNDLRTLKCEVWTGVSYPAAGGAEFYDFAPLQYRPVRFDYEALPYITGSTLTFRLSCTDGQIQVGKVLFEEIQKWD